MSAPERLEAGRAAVRRAVELVGLDPERVLATPAPTVELVDGRGFLRGVDVMLTPEQLAEVLELALGGGR